jgi:hypothetical protein
MPELARNLRAIWLFVWCSRIGETEPRLKRLGRPVHGVGRAQRERDVPIADGNPSLGSGFAELGHGGDVERGSQTASVGARLAVNEDRLLGSLEHSDEVGCLRPRQFPSRRHTEVDMDDAELLGLGNLRVVPRRASVLSAEINDRLNAVGPLVVSDVGRRRLRRSVEFVRDDRMEIAG